MTGFAQGPYERCPRSKIHAIIELGALRQRELLDPTSFACRTITVIISSSFSVCAARLGLPVSVTCASVVQEAMLASNRGCTLGGGTRPNSTAMFFY
jgi:hypothetical protein